MKKISQTIHHGFWLLIIIAIGIGLAVLVTSVGKLAYSYTEILSVDQANRTEVSSEEDSSETETSPTTPQYYMIGSAIPPQVSARAYIVADITTGDILASNGRKVVYPIASVTKLMTAVIADMLSPEVTIVEVSQRAVDTEGFRGGLNTGDELTVDELLYPLLLVSSNDAAEALAENFERNTFMKQMNAQAKFLGMKHTYFDDPSGLSEHNTATAEDIFTLLQYITTTHPQILAITDRDAVKIPGFFWENKNRMKDFDAYFAGGKTGFTNAAKQTGAAVFEVPVSGGETRALGIVILGSSNRENDIAKLIQYVQKHVHYGDQESIKELY
jgi:D-alanyl-D-alanine carboxypeptidase (penicillin-binding protein 5/6)